MCLVKIMVEIMSGHEVTKYDINCFHTWNWTINTYLILTTWK
jgi:hypothetical protein